MAMILEPMRAVESALAWAAQQGYDNAERAAKEYGDRAGREMFLAQPYYNAWAWRDRS